MKANNKTDAKVKTRELQEKAKAEKIEKSKDRLRTIEDYINDTIL